MNASTTKTTASKIRTSLFFPLLIFAASQTGWAQAGQLDLSFGTSGKTVTDIGASQTAARGVVVQPDGKIVTTGFIETDDDVMILTRLLPDGRLDSTFGSDGKVFFSFGTLSVGFSVALQEDGKILVAGLTEAFSGYYFLVVRFNPDGTVDEPFGNFGTVLTDFGTSFNLAYGISVQPDGMILVAGRTGFEPAHIALARYTSEGQLDNTFGAGGLVTTDIDSTDYDAALGLQLLPDGKIAVCGYADDDIATLRYLPNGQLDSTFGTNGIVLADFAADESGEDLAVQPDGKIVVAGTTGSFGVVIKAVMVRYLPDGQLDNTFGTGGISLADFWGGVDAATSVVLQPNGSIVMGGLSDGDFMAARFLPDGSPDSTFGSDGKVLTHFPSLNPDYFSSGAAAMDIQPDGKLVLAGSEYFNQTLVRYLPNGDLDDGFGSDGIVSTPFFGKPSIDYARAIARQPDGKMVVAGTVDFGSEPDFAVARYDTSGLLDDSFGTNGKVVTDFFSGGDAAYAVAIQTDGKVVVGGSCYRSLDETTFFALARYLPNGQLDLDFGTMGRAFTGINSNSSNRAYSMAIQPDGKIVLAGGTNSYSMGVSRFMPDGSLDSSFGSDGGVVVDFGTYTGSYSNHARAIVLQPDGKIIIAGRAKGNVDLDFALARLKPDGSIDETFGANGKVTTDFGSWIDGATAMLLQPDGKIVVGGFGASPSTFFLARYGSDGSLDPTFGSAGLVKSPPNLDELHTLALQQDGKIVAAGGNDWNDYFVLARYSKNGSLDNTFGINGIVKASVGTIGEDVSATAMLIQPDNKLVVAGIAYSAQTDYDFAIARFLPGQVVSAKIPAWAPEKLAVLSNPFRENTVLVFSISEPEVISIDIFDMHGQKVQSPTAHQAFQAGEHQFPLSLRGLPPGHYVAVLSGAKGRAAVKLTKFH